MKKFVLCLTAACIAAAASAETIIASSDFAADGNGVAAIVNGFTVSALKNGGSTPPSVQNLDGVPTLVVYAKGSVTVAGGDIAKIVFTLNGVSNARRYALFTPDTGALQPAQSAGDTEISWEGDAQSVTFTVGDYASMGTDGSHKAGQIHVVSVEIHGSAGSGGVAGIIVDEDGTPAEYFTMQGVRVYHPVRGGLYIRRQGGRASKVFVKATDPI